MTAIPPNSAIPSLAHLPELDDDCLRLIGRHLDQLSLNAVAQTCRKGYRAARALSSNSVRINTDSFLTVLSRFPTIGAMKIEGDLPREQRVAIVQLAGQHEHLQGLHLDITNTPPGSEPGVLELLEEMPRLTRLGMSANVHFDEQLLAPAARHRELAEVDFSACPGFRGRFMQYLPADAIKSLKINGSKWNSLPGMETLRGLPHIETLSLHRPDSGLMLYYLADLPAYPRLKRFSLHHAQLPTGVLQALFERLATLPALERIDIHGSMNLDANALAALAHHPRLRELHLSSCPLIDLEACGAISALPALERLSLSMLPSLNDSFVIALKDLVQVSFLRLAGEGIKGHTLLHLASLPHLRTLDLRDCAALSVRGHQIARLLAKPTGPMPRVDVLLPQPNFLELGWRRLNACRIEA